MTSLLRIATDTLLVRPVPPARSGFEQVVYTASGLTQVATLLLLVLLCVIFYRMWKAQQAMQEQLARLATKVDPMIASATSAAENVRVLTDVVKRDAAAAAEALSAATTRVRDSVSGIADRIDDVGELLGRVTDKAEAVAEVAGAAVSTIKAGSRLFRSQKERVRRAPPIDDALDEPGEHDEPMRLTDDVDGHESPYADEGSAPRGRPRRRRHRRRRGGGGAGGEGPSGAAPSP
jgi:HAMP domain-containing protein